MGTLSSIWRGDLFCDGKKNLFQIVCYFTSTLEEKCVDIKRLFSKEYSHDTFIGICAQKMVL